MSANPENQTSPALGIVDFSVRESEY